MPDGKEKSKGRNGYSSRLLLHFSWSPITNPMKAMKAVKAEKKILLSPLLPYCKHFQDFLKALKGVLQNIRSLTKPAPNLQEYRQYAPCR